MAAKGFSAYILFADKIRAVFPAIEKAFAAYGGQSSGGTGPVTVKDFSKNLRKAYTKGAREIKKETVKQLRKDVNIRGYSATSIKYGKKMDEGVRPRTKPMADIHVLFMVHIMGDFRLKFFERGAKAGQGKRKRGFTMKRKIHRPRIKGNSGVKRTPKGPIRGRYFFRTAISQATERACGIIVTELEKYTRELIDSYTPF
jgi:hypothetical protein